MLSIIEHEVVLVAVLTSILTIWMLKFYREYKSKRKLVGKKMSKKQVAKFMEEWKSQPAGIIEPNPIVVVHSSKFHNIHGSEGFIDNYKMEWLLRDETGKEWVEYHDNISLSDWEIIYGNNMYEIIMVELRLKDEQV